MFHSQLKLTAITDLSLTELCESIVAQHSSIVVITLQTEDVHSKPRATISVVNRQRCIIRDAIPSNPRRTRSTILSTLLDMTDERLPPNES